MAIAGAPGATGHRGERASRLDLVAISIGLIALNILLVGMGRLSWLPQTLPDRAWVNPIAAMGLAALSAACLISLQRNRLSARLAGGLGFAVAVWMAGLLFFGAGGFEQGARSAEPALVTQIALMLSGLGFALMSFSSMALAATGFGLMSMVAGAAVFRVLDWLAPGGQADLLEPFNPVSFYVALLIAWLSVACVYWHPRLGIRREMMRANLRGRILRYGLPLILALPFAAYVAAWVLARITSWDHHLLFAATASLAIAGGAVLVWWCSLLVEQLQGQTRSHVARLTRANEALERYASTTAHDLKAPIRHIRVYSELAIEALKAGESEKAISFARHNVDSCDALLKSVDHLLSFARSAYSRLSLSEHRLSELVRAATNLVDAELAGTPADIKVTADATIICDGHLMESVLQNLFSNSIKYRKDGEPPRIAIRAFLDVDMWRITVEDNGSGFARDFIPLAFDPLARGDAVSADGHGIGLTLCRTIMENHGGDVRIDEDYTDGARLVLTLPVAPHGPDGDDLVAEAEV